MSIQLLHAADISDDGFLIAVATTRPGAGYWRFRDDVQRKLEWMLGAEIPEKLFLAKARKLGRKQKLEGCTDCSCRGDYHLPRECYIAGCCYGAEFDWTTHPGWDASWAVKL